MNKLVLFIVNLVTAVTAIRFSDAFASNAILSPSQLESIAAEAAREAGSPDSRRANGRCPVCTVDYDSCPVEFDTTRSGACVPGPNYNGYCNSELRSFGSIAEAMVAESNCNFCFQCA